MSELFDKEVNAQKEKSSGVHASSRKPTKKCVMKMKQRNKQTNKETRKKKRRARKNVIDGGEHFIGCLRKTGGND